MPKSEIISFQLGKNGLTTSFLEALAKTFKKHELVKISVLKSCCRDRKEINALATNINTSLQNSENKRFTARIVGYTIFIRKWR